MLKKIEPLLTRRSIRAYKDKQITEKELKGVLEAGRHAPSGMNQHKLKFVVFQKSSLLDIIINDLGRDPFYGAKTMVAVFVDKNARTPIQDGCLALGNMMNGAHMMGVASCWVSSMALYFDSEEGKSRMAEWNIPDDYTCVGAVVLGYQEGEAMKRDIPDDLFVILD